MAAKTIKYKTNMTNILKVIKPFYAMEIGDTFELSQDGTSYSSSYTEENHEDSDLGVAVSSKYTSNYTISTGYAKQLVEEGYLAEVGKNTPSSPFVNVFDEIDTLLQEYTEELSNIDEVCADQPACLKVERETVLRNICTVLEHLKSLKK